ncbi:MAG TPA: hypothetical protein VF228_22630 [Iamia sp.]
MIVVDEYLAVRSLLGSVPVEVPSGPLALPASAHWRLLQRIHSPGSGQLSQTLSQLSASGREALRRPDPILLEILDPRPLLDEAARLAAAYGGAGLLVAETVTAGLHHGRQLWFGSERNIGRRLREIADDLDVHIHLAV